MSWDRTIRRTDNRPIRIHGPWDYCAGEWENDWCWSKVNHQQMCLFVKHLSLSMITCSHKFIDRPNHHRYPRIVWYRCRWCRPLHVNLIKLICTHTHTYSGIYVELGAFAIKSIISCRCLLKSLHPFCQAFYLYVWRYDSAHALLQVESEWKGEQQMIELLDNGFHKDWHGIHCLPNGNATRRLPSYRMQWWRNELSQINCRQSTSETKMSCIEWLQFGLSVCYCLSAIPFFLVRRWVSN